jgi:ABC-type Zn2+ transport system substrate-binding protein/surface adhesin
VDVGRQSQIWTRRRIVTFHGSLFYFAARYGLQVAGVVQPVPGSEPSARHIEALLAELRAAEPAALFSEPQLESQLATSRAPGSAYPIDLIGGGPGVESTSISKPHAMTALQSLARRALRRG